MSVAILSIAALYPLAQQNARCSRYGDHVCLSANLTQSSS